MPSYDYRCEATGLVVEVKHSMNTKISTWGELCTLAGLDAGEVPLDSPVTRLITGGNIVKSGAMKTPEPACAPNRPTCCGGGSCLH